MSAETSPFGQYRLREIEPRDDEAVARIIRDVMTEYGAVGPGFAIHDAEVDAMYAAYRGPESRYFVVTGPDDVPLGGGGFGRLAGTARVLGTAELRKMYFRPEIRGKGLGRMVLERCIREARSLGFRVMYLETHSSMKEAQTLYRKAGFLPRRTPLGATGHCGCDRYYFRDV
jgi:putative acetyltransferase